MCTLTIAPQKGSPQPLRWTGLEFDRADALGAFTRKRVELMDGQILEIPLMSNRHAQAIHLGTYALLRVFTPDWATVSIQCPMRLSGARPIPDFVVVAGSPEQIKEHPTTALLVVEVSDTSLEYDRTEKARLYAAHGIADYWVVDLNGNCVEVRRNPIGLDAEDPRYGEMRVVSAVETIAPLAAPQKQLKVADLLP